MQLAPAQLPQHLQRGLKPLYTLHGDEPLLIQEAADALRAAARSQGYTERTVHTVAGANFDWSEVLAAGAYGVHLGQEDLREADLGALAAAGVRLGLSTHGYFEMLTALHFRPSYIALGAVFPTTTKAMPTAPQGLARLARYVKLMDGVVPLVAIGGIDGAVLPQVLATGVGCAAVVRAVTEAADPAESVAALQQAFTQ